MRPLLRLFLALFLVTATRLFGSETVLRIVTAEKTIPFSSVEWEQLPRIELTAAEPHDQREHRYSGVDAREILRLAGAPLGEKLRGPALRLGVLVRGRDGYSVLLALAEFDAAFSARTLLLADRVDGQPLPEKTAPLQLIVPGDHRAARWVRMVSSLEIVSFPSAP